MPPALRHYDYRVFWSGQAVSSIGSQFTTVAMAWQIYDLTNSPVQLGLLGLTRALPAICLTLFGGLAADAFNRRQLMMVTQVLQFSVSASLAVLTALGMLQPYMLFVGAAFLAIFGAIDNPTRQAFVPILVPREDLTSALALASTQRQVGSIAGPAIGGIVLAASGPAWCYAVDASSWVVMLLALLMLHTRLSTARRGNLSFEGLRQGLAFVRTQPVILSLMALDFNANFFGSPRALLPVYARDIFHVGAQGLGILYAGSAVGSLLAAIAISMIGQPKRAGQWVLIGISFYAACAMGFAVSPSFGLAVLLLAGMGVGDAVSAVLRGTINQLITPDTLRGRVSSVNMTFTNGGPSLGQFESGIVAGWWGAEASAFTGGLATLVIVIVVAFVPALRRFQLPSADPVAEPQPAGARR